MSDNLEELLGDEENEEEYDLGDDEEEALLDDEFDTDIVTKNQLSSTLKVNKAGGDCEAEVEQDFVLDLDDGTELNDEEEGEALNATGLSVDEEQERCRKTDKFANERVVPISPIPPHNNVSVHNVSEKVFPHKQAQRYNQFRGRGRGGGNRGNYHNEQNRNVLFQQKKVLINPHFKGNVQIRNNVSLAWDNNHSNSGNVEQHKKPFMYIQPWAQNQQPVTNNFLPMQQALPPVLRFGNANHQPPPPVPSLPPQMNLKPPVHQRLGINLNLYNSFADNHQFMQTAQHQPYQQIPQVNIPNQIYDQPSHFNHFNNSQSQFNNQHILHNKLPVYNPPVCNNQSGFPNQSHNSYNPGINYNTYQHPVEPHAPSVFLQPCNNDYMQNITTYPQTIPVKNIDNGHISHYQKSVFVGNERLYQQQRTFSQANVGKRKFDNIRVELKKKKRNQLFTNLHEVQTVDTSVATVQMDESEKKEEEDEEMKAYRQKIEQQKLIREKILQQKEERRKQAAKKLQAHGTVLSPNELIKNIEIPVITNINVQPEIVVKNFTKNYNKKPQTVARVNQNIVPIKTVNINDSNVIKRVVTQNVANANRVVIAKNENAPAVESAESLTKDHLNSFLSNRKIFAKDQSLPDTSIVVVKNLATGTSAVKLRKLCQGVGDVQNLQMSTQERQATIQFKSVASAHAFYKKYQRFMLDLSMIQVALKPMS